MSYCVKCGLEYDEKSEANFCGRCGFNLRAKPPEQPSPETQSTPLPRQFASAPNKPIAGIIVALVLGIIGLLWTCAVLFQNLYCTQSNILRIPMISDTQSEIIGQ